MSYTQRLTEVLNPVAGIHPASYSTAQSTSWISASLYQRFFAYIKTGLIAGGGTFNAKFEQATNSSGGSAKDVTSKAITQLADTGDNLRMGIELRTEELDVTGGFDYIRLTVTPTAATLISADIFAFEAAYEPVSTTTWQEIID